MSKSASPSDYRNLQPAQIVETIGLLSKRIHERFPESGLYRVSVELHRLAQESVVRAQQIRRPNLWLRGGAGSWCCSSHFVVMMGARYVSTTKYSNWSTSRKRRFINLQYCICRRRSCFVLAGLRLKQARALDASANFAFAYHRYASTHKDPERGPVGPRQRLPLQKHDAV
jgi:hypothetical protein